MASFITKDMLAKKSNEVSRQASGICDERRWSPRKELFSRCEIRFTPVVYLATILVVE